MPKELNHTDYDEEPVTYCSRCYSLKIKHEDAIDADCCMDCGSTEVAVTTIENWERLYERRYGHKFVERNEDPRDSIYFQMSIGKLKSNLFKSEMLPTILYKLYPRFPKGLSKADSIILLFDKLSNDGRLDDLRFLLYDISKKKHVLI